MLNVPLRQAGLWPEQPPHRSLLPDAGSIFAPARAISSFERGRWLTDTVDVSAAQVFSSRCDPHTAAGRQEYTRGRQLGVCRDVIKFWQHKWRLCQGRFPHRETDSLSVSKLLPTHSKWGNFSSRLQRSEDLHYLWRPAGGDASWGKNKSDCRGVYELLNQ